MSDTSYPTIIIPKEFEGFDVVVNRVHEVMSLFGWTWYGMDTPPTKQMIREGILEQYVSLNECQEADDEVGDWISSGRLRLVKECVNSETQEFNYVLDIELGSLQYEDE